MAGFKKINSQSNLVDVANADIGIIEGHVDTDYPLQFPSLTTVERDAIVSPVNGMKIFNTTTGIFNRYEGGVWGVDISDVAANTVSIALGSGSPTINQLQEYIG